MPPLSQDEKTLISLDTFGFWFFRVSGWIINVLFFFALVFGIFRLTVILLFSFLEKFHISPNRIFPKKHDITTTVIVPAYNEAKVIAKTIDSLIASKNRGFNILIVDDGSTDNTLEVLDSHYRDTPRVTILTKSNSGKGESINFGISHTESDIIIIIDADTIFAPETVDMLERHFSNPRV